MHIRFSPLVPLAALGLLALNCAPPAAEGEGGEGEGEEGEGEGEGEEGEGEGEADAGPFFREPEQQVFGTLQAVATLSDDDVAILRGELLEIRHRSAGGFVARGVVVTRGAFSILVEGDGNQLFVGGDDCYTVDLSDRDNPQIIAQKRECFLSGAETLSATRLVSSGRIFDRASLEDIGGVTAFGSAILSPSLLVVYDAEAGATQIVDVADPAAPSVVATVPFTFANFGAAFVVANNFIYGVDDFGQFSIIDATNPALPVVRGGLDEVPAQALAVRGSTVVAFDDRALVIDVSDADTPAVVADDIAGVDRLAFASDDVFIGATGSDLVEISLSIDDPGTLVVSRSFIGGDIGGLALLDDQLLFTNAGLRRQTLDADGILTGEVVNINLDTFDAPEKTIVVTDNGAICGDGSVFADIDAAPNTANAISFGGGVTAVGSGNHCVFYDPTRDNLLVLDVADPANPVATHVDHPQLTDFRTRLSAVGDRVFAGNADVLLAFAVADPTAVTAVVGSFDSLAALGTRLVFRNDEDLVEFRDVANLDVAADTVDVGFFPDVILSDGDFVFALGERETVALDESGTIVGRFGHVADDCSVVVRRGNRFLFGCGFLGGAGIVPVRFEP